MNKINRWRKQIRSGGSAADRRRSFRLAHKIAEAMEAEHQASEYGGYGPGCDVCYGSGRSLRWIPGGDYGGSWGDPKICGCVRAPKTPASKCGSYREVSRAAGKRQIRRLFRAARGPLAPYAPWWPGRKGGGRCDTDVGSFRFKPLLPIREALYMELPERIRDEIEFPF